MVWIERLRERGYERTTGNTYEREIEDIPVRARGAGAEVKFKAAIDILVPAYTSRARDNVRVSDSLTTTEVRGLADALRRPGIVVELELQRLTGDVLMVRTVIPNEVSAVILKAFAWSTRASEKDAVDMWRMLEVASIAGLRASDFRDGDGPRAAEIVRSALGGQPGEAINAIARAGSLSAEAAQYRRTRIQGLVKRVLG